jgi:hypothetical protein
MAAIKPVLLVSDIVNGISNSNTFVGISKLHITWKLGAPEDISYTVSGDELDLLTPGLPPPGTRIIAPSLDGGLNADTRLLSTGTMVDNSLSPAMASEQGSGLALVLTKKVIERLSAQQVTIADVFNGKRGYVKPTSGGVVTFGGVLPTFQGIAPTTAALWSATLAPFVTFSWILPHFRIPSGIDFWGIALDIDVNRDTPLRATQAVAERLGSYVDPQRAQYVCDSGDYGVLYAETAAKVARTVTLGHLGTSPVCTFQNMADDTTPQPILEGSQFQPQTMQMLRSVRCKGGSTQHGVPFSGKLTDIVCINNLLTDATGDVQSGLPIISVYGDRNHGGVLYAPGDGSLHQWSQAMGVTSLCYSESLGMLYAATEAGVYQHASNIIDVTQWARLGAMALSCSKVIVVNQRQYTLATVPGSSIKHVLHYVGDGTNDPAGQTGYGFDGWESVYALDGLFDFSVASLTSGGQTTIVLYALSTTAPGFVIRHNIENPANYSPSDDFRMPIPGPGGSTTITPVGTGLDCMPTPGDPSVATDDVQLGTFLRTDSGSDGLYWIRSIANSMANVSPGHQHDINLVDTLNTPVQVNHVARHLAGILQWGFPGKITQRAINLMAGTSRGAYLSPQLSDGPWTWMRTDGQSNLGDINIKRIASGTPRMWLSDQIRCPIYGIDDSHLYVSYNGGINWIDVFANTLDAGPAFFHLHRKWALDNRYPNNDTTTINYPDKDNGPYKVVRSLDGLGQPAYAMVNLASQAPAEGDEAQEISQLATASMVPEIQGSILVLDAMARVLAYNAAPQTILQVRSKFSDTADALRFLRPTHQASVNGTVTQYISGVNGNVPLTLVTHDHLICYVLEHSIDYSSEEDPFTVYTTTKLGTLCLDDRSDPSKVDADLWNMVSRLNLAYVT